MKMMMMTMILYSGVTLNCLELLELYPSPKALGKTCTVFLKTTHVVHQYIDML